MNTTATAGLIEALQGAQRKDNLKDADFARQLGLSRQAWLNLRSGTYEPSLRTIRAIARRYDYLKPALWNYVMGAD